MSAPLTGLRIVVTRAVHQAEDLAGPLRQLGAEAILLPTVGIAPPADPVPLKEAATSLDRYDLVVFTSANAVRALAENIPPGSATAIEAAAVGPATREAAQAVGFNVHLIGDEFVAESLVEALAGAQVRGKCILVPSAAVSRDIVPNELRHLGAQVTVVEAYRNVCPPDAALQAREVFRDPLPHWALFASPSAFNNLLPLVDSQTLHHVRLASIGPTTTAAIRIKGYAVAAEAHPQTVEGLLQALLDAVAQRI